MNARDVNRRIEERGGVVLRQKGSHRFYRVEVDGAIAHTTVPQHAGDIPKGLLAKIQRDMEPALGKGWLR
ncbi:putative RNA binding protein YcfA (HicA-like mRNA interferase family) [Microbacteriaceae bacterium SG_E_30_P1]|uniref:RNA binding protein YcfA (HicA-like mRNA interferase family) n=1 Tax=Antiquaquibacter oligotrophicus TaxID=2880260 RepID=A0ABT6KKC2_9MICO|nr:type II toxin-antitoxin system HicA family toxin [Antiquaquibacter oligotrophicus]MDH6180406.1 putative RNA binding protein YcfA (HicA-like mRNA interferase family) [Antiquaquibacter oligotrophicus]UDF13854.1 type II toxin-antitoxin system HicA family toxin [Antiquaquibacter oligotrophicus]